MRLAKLQFEKKNKDFNGKFAQKCIRKGITAFKMLIWGDVSLLDIISEITLKLNLRPYIGRYTSPNESFGYNHLLSVLKNSWRIINIALHIYYPDFRNPVVLRMAKTLQY